MTIEELLALRQREARRLAESIPFSPEWDAAMTAIEDLDEAVRSRQGEASVEAAPERDSTDSRLYLDDL
jgi:hypothetical protein